MANGNNGTEDITLRDLFIAAALAGLQAHHDYGQNDNDWLVAEAIVLGEAMLTARQIGNRDTEPPVSP